MIQYEISKVYTLTPDYIQEQHDGRKYIIFKELYNDRQLRVKAFDFLSQPDADLPISIDVKVDSIDSISGMPLLKINRDWLIQTLYGDEKLPRKFSFNIVGKIDKEYKSLFLKDSFGISHYFPIVGDDSLDNYSEGERITLFAEGINKNAKGNLYISLARPSLEDSISQYIRVFTTKDHIVATEVKKQPSKVASYGDESETVEFKQSLVFHPKSSEVDVDGQVFNIMRSIAGFMNHIGGTLYIGVKNDGTAKGIEDDLSELNKGTNDSYGNYTADWDGWNRKLIDSVRKYLGSFAATLVSVEKDESANVTVAKIIIERSAKPIYVNNKILFRRQCNTTAMLTGDELTWFIIERLRGDSLSQFIEQKFGYETEIEDIAEEKDDTTSRSIESYTEGAIQDERNLNKWLYLRLFNNGYYTITKGNNRVIDYNQGNMICDYQLKQYHKNENQVLLLMYNGIGKVNKIDFDNGKNDWYYNDRNNIIQARNANAPWVIDSNIVIKCVDRNDMLVAFYKEGDKCYCYVRDVQDINPSHANREQALFTGGHALLTRGAELCGEIMHIPGTYRNWIAPIVNKQVELNDPNRSGTIRRLIDVLKDIYPNHSIE